MDRTFINNLIENQVPEGKGFEYKSQLNIQTASERKEFLADVSSFANTDGGYFIVGIQEHEGIPIAAPGIQIDNVDDFKLRLENILNSSVEPKMLGIIIVIIGLEDGNHILCIQISKSWNSPHMVTHQGHGKFYARNSAGKFPMDVDHLRQAYTFGDQIVEGMKKFRYERILNIYEGTDDVPVEMADGGKFVLHLIPPSAITNPTYSDISNYYSDPHELRVLDSDMTGRRKINLDGLVVYLEEGGRSDLAFGYTQLYRKGIIEIAYKFWTDRTGTPYIASYVLEKSILESLPRYLNVLRTLNIATPVFLFFSLIEAKNLRFAVPHMMSDETHYSRKDIINIPEIEISSFDLDINVIVKELFDSVWNVYGFRGTPYYRDGEFIQSREFLYL